MVNRPTAAFVDLDALARNFHATKEFVGRVPQYMAVVKANAYGHGALECSLRLESEGVDWFGVALPEEGFEIRAAGVTRPILCFGAFWDGQEELVVDNDITPVISDAQTASALDRVSRQRNRTLDIHVKIDTGMGRAGIRHTEATAFAEKLSEFKNLRVDGLLTHFAAAENPAEENFTAMQIRRFNEACDNFHRAGHTPTCFDMANSPGAIRHADSRGNLVRIGGALYGLLDDILPSNIDGPKLEPVLSLRSRISQVKRVPKGETLGYGRTFVTERETLVALVPIGYADGYPRGLSNKGKVILRGQNVPVVGRISMDWTLLDVTDVRDVSANDEVILIGPGIKAGELAQSLNTIGYEITCGISPRVPRIYQ